MDATPNTPLGFKAALGALKRQVFFGSAYADLPTGRSELVQGDDLVPQFGFVGGDFADRRVLMLGINPGNSKDDVRSPADARMMPAHARFAADPTAQNFIAAQAAYRAECESWPVWKRHCTQIIGAGKLTLDQIAYANCLPWRTASESGFGDDVAKAAARHYVNPLVAELQPKVIIAMGKRAAEILRFASTGKIPVLTWNRAQALTDPVRREREACAAEIFKLLNA